MSLIKIWIFTIDYMSFIIFLMGLVFGLVLFGLVFLIIVISTKKGKLYKIKSNEKVTPEDGERLIEKSVEDYKEKIKDKDVNIAIVFRDNSLKLVNDMASLFFPYSKRPLFELTVDELLSLVEVVANNIEQVLDSKWSLKKAKDSIGLALFVHLKNSQSESAQSFEMKEVKDKSTIWGAFSTFVKKTAQTVKSKTISAVTKKFVLPMVGEIIIRTCGQECYKAFALKLDLDTNITDKVKALEEELGDDVPMIEYKEEELGE